MTSLQGRTRRRHACHVSTDGLVPSVLKFPRLGDERVVAFVDVARNDCVENNKATYGCSRERSAHVSSRSRRVLVSPESR